MYMSSRESSLSLTPSTTPQPGHVTKYGTVIPNRIFVGGISGDMTEDELSKFFSLYGSVKDCKIITDRAGISKSYGFVTFENCQDAERIICKETADGLIFKDRKLNVGPAIRKQNYPKFYEPVKHVPGISSMMYNESGIQPCMTSSPLGGAIYCHADGTPVAYVIPASALQAGVPYPMMVAPQTYLSQPTFNPYQIVTAAVPQHQTTAAHMSQSVNATSHTVPHGMGVASMPQQWRWSQQLQQVPYTENPHEDGCTNEPHSMIGPPTGLILSPNPNMTGCQYIYPSPMHYMMPSTPLQHQLVYAPPTGQYGPAQVHSLITNNVNQQQTICHSSAEVNNFTSPSRLIGQGDGPVDQSDLHNSRPIHRYILTQGLAGLSLQTPPSHHHTG